MKEHECKESTSCTCSVLADEPAEDCPLHYGYQHPPRCEICGRYMKWRNVWEELIEADYWTRRAEEEAEYFDELEREENDNTN